MTIKTHIWKALERKGIYHCSKCHHTATEYTIRCRKCDSNSFTLSYKKYDINQALDIAVEMDKEEKIKKISEEQEKDSRPLDLMDDSWDEGYNAALQWVKREILRKK